MQAAGLRTAKNVIATSVEDALAHLDDVGLPAIIRPGVHARRPRRRHRPHARAVRRDRRRAASPRRPIGQVLIDESVLGWGEFELEVMRDGADNVVIVCSIENIDPMGVHTGDSVTVAPQQTLTDRLYQKLRDQAIAVIRAVGVETGGSNVQFAVNPVTEEIIVIEMNPRVSRSSALASKATGFPIAKIAARLAVGYRLDEIPNDITRRTPASFEPALDYVVVKWPRFAFEKFPGVDATLSTHMKSVGEVMAIGRTFRQAFAKAMRSRELDAPGAGRHADRGAARGARDARRRPLRRDPRAARPRRRRRGGPRPHRHRPVVPARAARCSPPRARAPATRTFRAVDTCAAEFEAETPYYYSAWERGDAAPRGRPRRQAERDDPRLGPEPDRPGHRVRLLLRARRDDRARVRPRRGDGQLQPGDGLDRLRHVRPPVLRAADARGRARDRRGRAARGRDRPVRRPDAAQARRRARGARACRCSAPSPRRSTSPRTAAASARCSASSASRRRRTRPRTRATRRWPPRRASASRCSCARATCSAAARWRSSTRSTGCADYLRRERVGASSCASTTPTRRRPAGARDLPRPLPRERDRGRRRRDLRRRGRLDRRDHAARRGGRHPLGRLRVRAAAALARRRDARRDPPRDARHRARARHGRADQRPVRRARRGPLRDRGQPARVADGPVRLQGDRAAAGQARLPGDARRAARRPRAARGPGCGTATSRSRRRCCRSTASPAPTRCSARRCARPAR